MTAPASPIRDADAPAALAAARTVSTYISDLTLCVAGAMKALASGDAALAARNDDLRACVLVAQSVISYAADRLADALNGNPDVSACAEYVLPEDVHRQFVQLEKAVRS